jgi:hypothetical protein
MVDRKVLVQYIESVVSPEPIHKKPTILGVYQREGRKDKIILVETIDLAYLANSITKKS